MLYSRRKEKNNNNDYNNYQEGQDSSQNTGNGSGSALTPWWFESLIYEI